MVREMHSGIKESFLEEIKGYFNFWSLSLSIILSSFSVLINHIDLPERPNVAELNIG